MHKEPQHHWHLVTARHLVDHFGLTWYKFAKYRKLGVIPPADAFVNGRPAWFQSRVKHIESRLAEL